MRKKTIFLLICVNVLVTTTMSAQCLRQLWLTMPDSIAPYLNQNQRSMLLDYYEMGGNTEIKNGLDGITRIDTLSHDYLSAHLNNAVSMQIGILPVEGGDSVACVLKTFQAPAEESDVILYSPDWEFLQRISIEPELLFQHPDTMSEAHFEELKSFLAPQMIKATYSSVDKMLTFCFSIPFNYSDKKDELKTILLQRNLNWNGKTFKECYNTIEKH